MAIWSLQIFAHAMTAVQLWFVQNFVEVITLEFERD